MGKILRTTKSRLDTYRRRAVAGLVVTLGAGLIAAAPAHADGPTVGSQMYHYRPMQRPMIQRPYYGGRYYGDRYYNDRHYGDRYHRGFVWRGRHHCRDHRFRYHD